ncbi:hypothetical protein ACX0G7_11670 [Flavitalea antarctica]
MASSERSVNPIVIVLLTVLLGGTAPFWWKYIDRDSGNGKPNNNTEQPETGKNDATTTTQPNDNPCRQRTDDVSTKIIETKSADARTVSGDSEIDSDDWTGLELSYRIYKTNRDREIEMTVTWYAQEKNSDRSPGNTRIMSSKVIPLYKIDGCPELVIEDITGIELQGTKTEDFSGEIHDFVNFPDFGLLRNIRVRFDGPGANDDSKQHLTASVASFSVVLGIK